MTDYELDFGPEDLAELLDAMDAEHAQQKQDERDAAKQAHIDAWHADVARNKDSGNPTIRAIGRAEETAGPPPYEPEKDDWLDIIRGMPRDLIHVALTTPEWDFLFTMVEPRDFREDAEQLVWAEACNYHEEHGVGPTPEILTQRVLSGLTEDDEYEAILAVTSHKPNDRNRLHIGRIGKERIAAGKQATTRSQVIDAVINAADSEEALKTALAVGLQRLTGEPTPVKDVDKLVRIAENEADLWLTQLDEPVASIERDGHREHWPTSDDRYTDWLAERFRVTEKHLPREDALAAAADTSGRMARLGKAGGPQKHEAFVRVGYEQDTNTLWVDLCDPAWRAVKITANGWEVVPQGGVRFRRTALLAPLPEPERGGSWDMLRPLANVSDEEWPLYLAFLVGCLLPTGMLPIAYATGSKDTGKSSLTHLTQGLLDPREDKPITGIPREEDFLLIAEASYLQAYNNVSKIQRRESDGMCCLVEGASDPRRKLYTNKALCLSKARRPIIINGIGLAATAGDLLSRIIPLSLMAPVERLGETEYAARCEAVRPKVLGCLYDAVATALRSWQTVTIADPPRLLDMAKWVVAAEPALPVEAGTIIAGLRNSREETMLAAMDASPVAKAIKAVVKSKGGRWTASTADWLTAINTLYPAGRHTRDWPKEAKELGDRIARDAADYPAISLQAEKIKNRAVGRGWEIRLVGADETGCDESVTGEPSEQDEQE